MYLVVFMFLLVSIVGLHMQVYMMEASKMFDRETSMAHSMIVWHKASEKVVEFLPTLGNTDEGCSLSSVLTTPAACSIPPSGCDGPNSTKVPCRVQDPINQMDGTINSYSTLPHGYNFVDYKWLSLAYTPASGTRFVVTYAVKPSDDRAPVAQPAIGLTLSQLFRQFQTLEVSLASYGEVVPVGGECHGVAVVGKSQICLQSGTLIDAPVDSVDPTKITIPDGSLVVLTAK